MSNHGRVSDPGAYVNALAAYFEANGGSIVKAEFEDFVIEKNTLKAINTSEGVIDCNAAVVATGVLSLIHI